MMTGIRPSTSGVYINPQPWRKSPVLAEAKTIPQWFMDHGYTARASGKIYHGAYPDPESWQEYWPSQTQTKPKDPLPAILPVNGIPKTSHFDWGAVSETKEEMGDWKVAEWISRQLAEKADDPFFLACGFYRPHLPWFAPQEYFDKFPIDSIQLPEVLESDLDDIPAAGIEMAKPKGDHAAVTKHDQWKAAVQGYLANINFVDECLGKVLDALESGPNADDTIVVLWSDHGWHLGEKEHWRKFSLWEEATRVQMMWRVPGVTEPGGQCKAPVNLLDIYPTLVDLCGLRKNEALEGRSLSKYLSDPSAKGSGPTLTTHGRNNHALRSSNWRYIRYADGSEELYDHRSDPLEHTNLAELPEHAAIKKELASHLPGTNVKSSPGNDGKKKKKAGKK